MARLHPSSPTERRGAAGYTLLEVLLAMMLTSVMVTAVFSVSLTARRDTGKNDRRLLANQIARTLSARLSNYVSGCCNSGGCNGAGGSPVCGVNGPNALNSINRWSINDNVNSPPTVIDSQGNVYALAAGQHNITGAIIPTFFAAAPYNAYATYTVAGFGAGAAPNIASPVQVSWTEPYK